MDFLQAEFAGNTLGDWLLAVLVAAAALVALQAAKRVLLRHLTALAERTDNAVDDFAAAVVRRTQGFFLAVLGIFAGARLLDLAPAAGTVLGKAVVVALLLQGALWGNGAIRFLIDRYMQDRLEDDAASATTIKFLGFIARLGLWLLIGLVGLDNLGLDITTLIAGLGVGGIAVALAVQNILGDLFGSLSIVLDKPFVIGDFIIVDDLMGTVEHIGLKTTRVRSLSGEQLVFSNADLLGSRIRNYKRMFERRVVFSLGVTYQTPYEKLAAIPGMLRSIIEAQPHTRFDRAHFHKYGDFALIYEVVYYVLDPDYNTYMDTQQAINLEVYRRFAAEGIEFAYPTQTLFVQQLAPVAAGGG